MAACPAGTVVKKTEQFNSTGAPLDPPQFLLECQTSCPTEFTQVGQQCSSSPCDLLLSYVDGAQALWDWTREQQ